MSANLVSMTHIRALVSAAVAWDDHDELPVPDWTALFDRHPEAFQWPAHALHMSTTPGWRRCTENELGRALWLANLDSLRARYPGDLEGGLRHDMLPDGGVAELLAYRHALVELPVVSALKQVRNFAYQASEVTDWPNTWAAQFCAQLERLGVAKLPGYDAAPWGIEDPEEGAPEPGTAGAPISLFSMAVRGRS